MASHEEIPLRSDVTHKSYQEDIGTAQQLTACSEAEVTSQNTGDKGGFSSLDNLNGGHMTSASSVSTDEGLHGYSLANKIFRTVTIGAAYFGAALNLGIIGPSLLDLRKLTHTTKSQISTIFTVRGILAIIGSLALGPILDCMDRYVAVGLSLIITCAFTIAAPWTKSLAAVLLTLGPPEFFGCALGMGTHLLCVDIWQSRAGPFLQLLNFVSVSGFAVAPLLVKPFLSEHQPEGESLHCKNQRNSQRDNVTKITLNTSGGNPNIHYSIANTTDVFDLLSAKTNLSGDQSDTADTHIYISYLIVGLYCLAASMLFLVIIISDRRTRAVAVYTDDSQEAIPEKSPSPPHHGYSRSQLYLMYFLFFLFILFYGGIEVGYPSQVTTFAVEHLCMPKGDGALLASLVMGSNAVFTALGILLVHFIRPNIIIWIDVLGLTASLVILTLLVNSHPQVIWLCSFLLGASSASIMPCAYTWANDLFKVTGLFNSAFWCGFFSGYMATPALAGFLMERFGNMWYLYTMLVSSLLVLALFSVLSIVAARNQDKPAEVS